MIRLEANMSGNSEVEGNEVGEVERRSIERIFTVGDIDAYKKLLQEFKGGTEYFYNRVLETLTTASGFN